MLSPRRSFMRLLALTAGVPLAFGRQTAAAQAAQSTTTAPAQPAAPASSGTVMPTETVTGIGGFFFRAHDPEALGKWYLEHLGIALTPTSFKEAPWHQQAGPTLLTPFPEKTSYFDSSKGWMINFRVRDLDKMAAQLQSAGVAVKIDAEVYQNNRFAHLHDPEGNPIELWQPGQA